MGTAKRTLSILAITTVLMGCSAPAPPASPATTPVEAMRIYATTTTFPLVLSITSEYIEDVQSEMTFNTQYASYRTIVDELMGQEVGFVITSHLPPEQNLWAAPIAKDGILIVTSSDVSIMDLTVSEIRAIYQGRLSSWADVGGEDREIVPFSRERDSDVKAEFARMVMGNRTLTAEARVVTSTEQMMERILNTPGAIGYIPFGERNVYPQINILAVDGVVPSIQTISDDIYPLRSTVFVVGVNEPTPDYRKFISWIQGARGQSIVAQNYVPLISR